MKQFKWWEKILFIIMTPLFMVSYFCIFITSVKSLEEEPVFFIIGSVFAAISVVCFFGIIKILSKYYNYRNRKGIYRFFGVLIVLPLISATAVLFYHQKWINILEIVILAVLFVRCIAHEFGRFSFKINRLAPDLHVQDITSFNADLQVIGKNQKVKSSTDKIRTGDTITIKKDGETILTVEVVKNKKEQ